MCQSFKCELASSETPKDGNTKRCKGNWRLCTGMRQCPSGFNWDESCADGDTESYRKVFLNNAESARKQEHPKAQDVCLWIYSACQCLMPFVCTKYFCEYK